MHFSLLSIGPGMNVTNSTFMVMIAVLACILGAEIAGIGILISKLLRARRAKYDTRYEVDEEESSSHRHYSVGLLLLLGAVPQSTYIALSVLITLTAIMAVVFVLLLIIFRICGYDLVSSKRSRPVEEPETEAEAPMPEVPTEDATAYEEARYPEETEEQRQEAYTVLSDASYTEEDPFAVLNEESVAEVEDETDDTVEEAATVEEEPVVAECADVQVGESVAPVATSTTVTTSTEEPSFADGTRPYKVVEKVVTETVKEIYKETPAPEQHSTTNDAVMEKLVDLLDYEIRSRRELELAEAAKNEKTDTDASKKSDGSVATFAMTGRDADEELDDEDDEDEVDELEESDETKSENDDVDDEENDTEGDHFTGNERIIGFDEATGCYIVAHYRKSFEAKLIQARPNIKKYYSDIKNALLSYKGTKNRISWNADSFHNGREQIAKINVKTRILEIYLALDPASLDGTVYRGKDVGSKKKYADTPFQYKVRTPRKFKWAMELVQRVCEEHGLSPIDIEPVNYEEQYPFDTTENLVERKLIKEYIRQEKPATSFELDPDHVPEVPEEDESVIPANANFSWEFDNEMLVEQEPISEPEPEIEPEPAPEPEPEPELVEEPTPAPEAAPAATVTRETVKVTEMRYTERYYTDAAPTYEQVITTTEPIEPIEAPVESAEAAETVIEDATETFDDILSENEVADEEVVEVDPFEDDAEASEDSDFEEVDGVVAEDVTEESYAESDESYDEIDEEADDASEEELFFEDEATDADGEDFAEEESFEEEAFEEEELPADEGDFEESFEEEAYEEEAYEEETNEEEAYEEEKESEEVIAVPEKSRNDTAGTLPFRPSFYANRNYYAEETPTVDETDDVSDEEDESIAVNSTWDEDDGEAYNDGEEYEEDEYAEEEYAEDDYADEEYPDEDSEAEAVLGEDDDADEYEEDEEEDAPAPQPAVARNVNPSVALVDLCSLEAYFDEGDVINLDSLKVRELVLPSASILKLYASGPISKRFIVEANHFTLDAIKAISDADGDSVMVR